MRFFEDKHGRVVLYQRPNLPLILWIAATVASWLTEGRLQEYARIAALAAGIAWALLELVSGATPFRKVLGAGVLAWLILSRVL